jgi:hypothetical protein
MPSDGCIYARRVRRTSCSSLHTYTKWKNKTGRIFNLKLISLIDIRKPSTNAAPALFPRSANYPAGGPIYRREFTQDKHAPGRARLIKALVNVSVCVDSSLGGLFFFSFLAIRFQAKIDRLHFSSLKIYTILSPATFPTWILNTYIRIYTPS